MDVSSLIGNPARQVKAVFVNQPLEILLSIFFGGYLLCYGLEYNNFLQDRFAYWLFFPIYFAVIYLARHQRWLYWLSPLVLALLTTGVIINFGTDLDFYLAKPQFWGLLLITLICFLSEGWHRTNRTYVYHVTERTINLSVLAPITAYLCLGVSMLVLGSISYLFGVDWSFDSLWSRLFFFCTFGLLPLFFLVFEREQKALNHFFEFIVNYILSPVLMIYSLILYLYIGKILFMTELPKGNVSFIVLPYLCGGIILSALQTVLPNPKWQTFYRLLPYIVIVPLILLWVGILERINTYSFTEVRVYLCAIALTVTLFCVLSLWKRLLQYRYLALIMIAATFITTFLINPKQIGFEAQNARLRQQLTSLNLLNQDGKIRTDVDFIGVMKQFDKTQRERYQQAISLLMDLHLMDNRVAEEYGKTQFDTLREKAFSIRYDDENKSLAGYMYFPLDSRKLDLSYYSNAILFGPSKTLFGETIEPSGNKLYFEDSLLTVFNGDKFVHSVLRKNGLDPYVQHSEEELYKLREQFVRVETAENILIFESFRILFDQQRGYLFESGGVILFLQK